MFFDGAVNQNGNGVGAVLVSPKGAHIPIAVKFGSFAQTISLNIKRVSQALL